MIGIVNRRDTAADITVQYGALAALRNLIIHRASAGSSPRLRRHLYRRCAMGCAVAEVSSPAPARRPDSHAFVHVADGTRVAVLEHADDRYLCCATATVRHSLLETRSSTCSWMPSRRARRCSPRPRTSIAVARTPMAC